MPTVEEKISGAPAAHDTEATPPVKRAGTEASLESVQELLEKNLKWSQIIYEQNRRINHKLMWSAVANWLRLLVIVIPIVLGILFLPPLVKQLMNSYSGLLNTAGGIKSGKPGSTQVSPASLENILQLLPLDAAQKAQLKTMLK